VRALLPVTALALVLLSTVSHAAPILTSGADGYTWSTITHAGNRAPNASEHWLTPFFDAGAVSYEYRIATTEVTSGQWLEFVRAYAPYVGAEYFNPAFNGGAIFVGFNGQGTPQYSLPAAASNIPTSVGWRYAARFCNWMHNGKALTQAAFENGAYDTSTFTRNPDGTFNDQLAHNSDARYWIPTMDEWIKAAHYDPNRYGEGQDGYWRYPNSSNEPLTPGAPGEPGAQTSAGWNPPSGVPSPDAGAYPDANAPWGLLDTSGGVSEWFESPNLMLGEHVTARYYKRSEAGLPDADFYDMMDVLSDAQPVGFGGIAGLRLASPVPAPSTLALTTLLLAASTPRRRRRPA